MRLVTMTGAPTLRQLHLEERLLQPFPRDIMSWTGQFYSEVFNGFGDFHLRENDYAFNHRKFGGKAQSITKDRWVHHTSFLWDYGVKNMDYLKIPKRAPEY
ncbi:uncharacterized protein LOC133906741 [Phragmites australis]|uniref:uncharacterized protein LOC133906741 n=1 Tax=Phragmites australis TaxID=29695 RepID=UPI002D768ADB|nr:uncharacterized protein LOC133906741 [Phragmites australis]